MKRNLAVLIACYLCFSGLVQAQRVTLTHDKGARLQVDGEDFFIKGMNWDYFPIGFNYEYNFWTQPEETITAALESEMSLLKAMGVNAIRVYVGIPPKWITHIYQNYGILTLVNHSFGRYGLSLNGNWVPNTRYQDTLTQKLLLKEVEEMAQLYKKTPGLLMYMLGNENNYGLFWKGAETEDFPNEEARIKEIGEKRAEPMYRLMNEAAKLIKSIDASVPVAVCNGDLLFLEILAKSCPDVDIYGTNMYRGISFGDAFDKVKEIYGKPLMFTEFGSDAYDALKEKENPTAQAQYLVNNWAEIYQNAAGLGKAENSLGGFTFQFSDGWWKYGQTYNLDQHDTHASWENGGYKFDYQKGQNNMNEEWFGICAKGPTNADGLYTLYPRAAYFALQEMHQINPYTLKTNRAYLDTFLNRFSAEKYHLRAKAYAARLAHNQALLPLPKEDAKPVWQQEFNEQAIDTSVWQFDLGRGNNGWGNAELQYYTQRTENIKQENGLLIITARQEPYEGARYTSARIKTKGKFEKKFGRIEARIKLPKGQGMWPAFWMLGNDIDETGWPNSGEIDIMEYRGQEPKIVLSTLHGPGYSGNQSISKNFLADTYGFDGDFHVFGVDWRENLIRFYVDDLIYHQLTPEDLPGPWVFNKPFYIILNLAVGGNFLGSPNNDTSFPQTLQIDYVRVYD